jgi:conjugative relaxase-like TrwC/TraI family protein
MISYKILTGKATNIIDYVKNLKQSAGGYYTKEKGAPFSRFGSANIPASAMLEDILSGTFFLGRQKRSDQRLGIDLTISAPKSVSIIALALADESVIEAHKKAVIAALHYVEQEMCYTRLGKNGSEIRYTKNLIAGTFLHEDARSVDDVVDPQLHTHCVIANGTQIATGQWRALRIDFGKHNEKLYLLDAIYKSALAKQLIELGYTLENTEDGFEIAGFTPQQLDAFSARKIAIDQKLATQNKTRKTASAKTRSKANLATRNKKNQLSQEAQRQEWRQRAIEEGILISKLKKKPLPQKKETIQKKLESLFKNVREHLAERQEIFSKEALTKELLLADPGAIDYSEARLFIDQKLKSAALISLNNNEVSDPHNLIEEAFIEGYAIATKATSAPVCRSPKQSDDFINAAEQAQNFAFTKDQRNAIAATLKNGDTVFGIVGAAGAGKTTALHCLVRAFQNENYQVIGLGPSAQAVEGLEKAGADDIRTLQSFLLQQEHQTKTENHPRLIILDEAGMVATRDCKRLLETLNENDRLLLVGDPGQLEAVEAGTPFAHLLKTHAIDYTAITEIQRQKNQEHREIAELFAKGKAKEAVTKARAFIEAVSYPRKKSKNKNAEEKNLALVEAAAAKFLALSDEEKEKTLLITGTNQVRADLNKKIREALRQQKKLSAEQKTITVIEKIDATRAQRARASWYKKQLKNQKLLVQLKDQRYTIETVTDKKIILQDSSGKKIAKKFEAMKAAQVFQQKTLDICQHELVQFRLNDKKLGVKNGDKAIIQDIRENTITLLLHNGKEIHLDKAHLAALEYAYAVTTHSNQGATVDRTIVVGEASRVATANLAYVALTRHRQQIEVITDNTEKLCEVWQQWSEKKSVLLHKTTENEAIEALRAEGHAQAKAFLQDRDGVSNLVKKDIFRL